MQYKFDDNEIQPPAEIAEAVRTARLPEAYKNAKQALAACESLDEVNGWANVAEMFASCARMAEDETLEKLARQIRARAYRRLGELLQSYDGRGRTKKKPEGGSVFTRAEAAKAAGVSENRALTAVRIAAIPQDEFEDVIESEPPGTSILAQITRINRPHPEKVSSITPESLQNVTERARAARTLDALISLGREAVIAHVLLECYR